MIPFGSQRALGQDLATHLMNTHDNERMELLDVRGAVAKDLHGAFAEWELQAHALTRCKNYLYSLSINPDPAQGPLTPEQYEDYIARVEHKLGLEGQPRAIVMHIKDGREHAHVVWSRIDAEAGKAVQIAFDREKLMMVTREFARDHGLELPGGYDRDGHGHDQLSLYEKAQQDKTGVTKGERIAHVTDAWRQREASRPTGLAAFLGRVTGMNFLVKALRTRHDARRLQQHEQEKQAVADRQKNERQELAFRQRMQRLSHERRLRALDRLEAREMKSLTTKQLADERAQERDGFLHLPTLGRKQREKTTERDGGDDRFYPDVQDDFTRAADPGHDRHGDDDGGGHGDRDYRSLFKNRRNTPKKSPGKNKGDDIDR